jgi:integrase
MNWLPASIIPKRQWPPVCHKEKRAITFDEHSRIIEREHNPATRAFYQLLGHLGGSQSDIATLTAEDIDWRQRTIAYRRHKTGVTALILFGEQVAAILRQLPKSG